MDEAVVLAPSARRHGCEDDDVIHAYRNPIRMWEIEDGMTLVVGGDRSGRLLEIGVVDGPEGPVIVHAMEAREKFLR